MEIYIPLSALLTFIIVLLFVVVRRNTQNFWIYDYTIDPDQIRRFYKRNLRTDKTVKVYSAEYYREKSNNAETFKKYKYWNR